MQKNYEGLDFGDVKIVNSIGGPIYQGVLQGEGDVGVGFTTDSQLASDELVVMEDPKNIWPFYYPAPVVRSDVLEKNPKMEEALNAVSETLDAETMRRAQRPGGPRPGGPRGCRRRVPRRARHRKVGSGETSPRSGAAAILPAAPLFPL